MHYVSPIAASLGSRPKADPDSMAKPTCSPAPQGRRLGAVLACALLLFGATLARAQVHDNAGIFSKDAIEQARQTMDQIKNEHRHSLLVETYAMVPDSMQDDLRSKGKEKFFQDWAEERRQAEGINGVVVLIVMNPGHLQINVGNETLRKLFTQADRIELQGHLTEFLHDKKYNDALTKTATFVLKKFDDHDPSDTGATNSAVGTTPRYTPPTYSSPTYHSPGYSPPTYTPHSTGIPTFFCLIVGVIIVIALLRMVFRSSGGGYGGGYGGGGYGGGGYGGGYGGGTNYPPPGYGGNVGGYGPGYAPPSRGSGFGSGLLGGLLGGAVGGYAADRLMHQNDGGNAAQGGGYSPPPPPDAGGSFTPDTSSSGGGSDFGSSSDSSSSSGADFGSADSGGGSGGSDFGGGGDSGGGSSGGSDF